MTGQEYSVEYSKLRLRAVLEEIGRLKELTFPYSHSEEALHLLEQEIDKQLTLLDSIPPGSKPDSVRSKCMFALGDMLLYLALLGFILRSTDVRNAFEVYGPFLSLSRKVLGKDTKLILSSEWDYSPFTYKPLSYLRDFVLIGLPAPESSNPLLIPLGGHELGHTIWELCNLEAGIRKQITENILTDIATDIKRYMNFFPADGVKESHTKEELTGNLLLNTTIHPAVQWGTKQSTEYFCDFCGLFLFDMAFLDASAYLLSPRTKARSPQYPNIRQRAERLIEAAAKYNAKYAPRYGMKVDYRELFEDIPYDLGSPERTFLLALADKAAGTVAPQLMEEAESILSKAGVPQISPEKVNEIVEAYKFVVPKEGAGSLTNILNAAWDVHRAADIWPDLPEDRSKQSVLRDLVLKNIEVLDMEEITGK